MTNASPPVVSPAAPATVGLWLEFDAGDPPPLAGDARIRHARGLVTGLDAIPAVEAILLPCLPADLETMTALFADALRPGRLLSDKLRVISAGREPPVRGALIGWSERRRDSCRDRLTSLGATGSPPSWRAALAKLAEDPTRRAFAVPRRIIKLVKLTLRLKVAEAILAAARLLPPSQASVVADLRRRGLRATWIVLPAVTASARRLPGRKILDLGGGVGGGGPALVTLARAAVAVVAPSQHAADRVAGVLAGRPCEVIPPPPLPVAVEPTSEEESRRRLGDDLRTLFMGSEAAPLHRYFCDFPFERVEYLVAAAGGHPRPLLPAYATVLRRHRRNLKLLIDGRLPRSDGKFDDVALLGLSFDVAEAAGLGEAARARLLRHARAVVVADGNAGCLPAVFGEAVAAGTPVVMGRMAAVREVLTPAELSGAEYFDVASGEADGLVAAMVHALDHREAVLARQQSIVARLARRTWADVASEMLLRTVPG